MERKKAKLQKVREVTVEVYEFGPIEVEGSEEHNKFKQDPAAYVREVLESYGHEVKLISGNPELVSTQRMAAHHIQSPPRERSHWIVVQVPDNYW